MNLPRIRTNSWLFLSACRIEKEFTIAPTDLLASIRHFIPDATERDVKSWDEAGLLEYKILNGERRYCRKAAYDPVHICDAAAR